MKIIYITVKWFLSFFFFFLIKTFSLVRWFFFCCFQEFFLWKGTTKCHIPQGNSIFFFYRLEFFREHACQVWRVLVINFITNQNSEEKKKPDEKQFENSQKLKKFNSMNVKKYNYKFFEYLFWPFIIVLGTKENDYDLDQLWNYGDIFFFCFIRWTQHFRNCCSNDN